MDCLDSYGSAVGTCSDKVSWSIGSPSTSVTLTATPAAGSLACWSPDGINDECGVAGQAINHSAVLLPNGTVSVSFFFELTQETLIVMTTGTGTGAVYYNSTLVSASGGGLGTSYDYGKVIQLTPVNGIGTFKGWGRDCAGQGATCTLTMDATHRVTAEFDLPGATPALTSTAEPQPTRTPMPGGGSPGAGGALPGSSAGGSPGSTVLGDTAGPASSGGAESSSSPSLLADPKSANLGGSDPPWLPIILLVLLVLVGVNVVVFQLVRARKPGP
jgi:hypothetical protein